MNGSRARLASGGRRPFAISGSKPHYAPDLPFRVQHILLDVKVDPQAKTLKGAVTHRVTAVMPGQRSVKLDQIGLRIEAARLGDKAIPFAVEGGCVRLQLRGEKEAALPQGESLEFTVQYSLKNSPRGLYFTGPDAFYPKKPYQVWAQGQDEDSRYWFPTFDYPNQKATSEMIATVPKGFTAVSNGALQSKSDTAEGTRFHYKLGTPHVTYLITLAVAEFSEWAEQGPGGLPVQYFVQPGREDDGRRAFGNTPKMIEAFAKKTGVPYPYEKYSQVAVQDFIFGGMENTSATTQTDLTLHDARAHIDFSSDPLVSHELAHQWFGDLLTCRDWSHGWLNEGFATFMERVWIENNPGKDGGFEEAKYYSYQDLKEYLESDRNEYRRPIVCNTYIEPIDLFDQHLYQKGGLVLNLMRQVIGEDLFWKSINTYVTRHRGQSVETLDLIRAIEDTTGRNLRRFFDEWVFGAGYPEFELSYSWHDDKKLAELVIEQKQTDGQPFVTKDGATTHLFHLPVALELTLEGGKKVTTHIEIGEARERIFLAAESKPLMVRFDPNHFVPKTLKFPRPKEMLLYQLANDADCMGRIEAAKELVKLASADVVTSLGKAAAGDPFWGVQAEAADALGQIRTEAARDALIAALATPEAKARRAIVAALGKFKDDQAAAALRKVAERDASYFVEGEAGYAFAAANSRPLEAPAGAKAKADEAEYLLLQQLEKPSYREVIRARALRGLAQLPGIARGERPKAIEALMRFSERGQLPDARGSAILALGDVARIAVPHERARILQFLGGLAEEDNFRVRLALVGALPATEAPEAAAILGRIQALDLDGRVRRHAQLGVEQLATAGTLPESVGQLKESLEKLQEEHRKLRASFEEARVGLKTQ